MHAKYSRKNKCNETLSAENTKFLHCHSSYRPIYKKKVRLNKKNQMKFTCNTSHSEDKIYTICVGIVFDDNKVEIIG